jgi:hypothetical protein
MAVGTSLVAALFVAIPRPTPAAAGEPAVMVMSAPQSKTFGSAATVTATVIGDDGNPVPGRVVVFDIRGGTSVNPDQRTATTDAQGNATIDYSVYLVGDSGGRADVVTASTAGTAGAPVSGVTSVVWSKSPAKVASTVTFAPPGMHAPGGTTTLDFVGTFSDGTPVRRIDYSIYPLGGSPSSSETATADEFGHGRITVTTSLSEVEVHAVATRLDGNVVGDVPGRAVVTTRAVPTGPVVAHAPVATTFYGQPISITATSTCPTGANCTARVYYRTTAVAALTVIPGLVNEPGFQAASLSGTATTVNGHQAVLWSGSIPGSAAASTTGVDYYIEADHNGTRTVYPGSTTVSTVQPVPSYHHVQVVNPPLVNHVPVPFAVADQPINVDAQVTCSSGNCSGTLFYRETPVTLSPTLGWASTGMTPVDAGTPLGGAAVLLRFRGTVPASSVDTTGVDYYLRFTDGHTQTFHPGTGYQGYYAPRDGTPIPYVNHHVHVIEPPRVVHEPVASAPYRRDVPISAQTNCPATRQCQATLYYRTTQAGVTPGGAFASTPMTVTRVVGAAGIDVVSVEGRIPAGVVDTRGVDYYFSVTDGTTTSWWPGTSAVDGPGTWVDGTRVLYQHVHVQEPPHFVHAPLPIAQAAQSLAIETQLTCATESCNVTLHYSSTPNTPGTYQTVGMGVVSSVTTSATRVETRRAVIPASRVTTRGLAYYMTASDGYTNTASPGTSYWGTWEASIDGGNPAPETLRHLVRVVDPPHPVHAPVGFAFTGEPVDVEALSNCAAASCPATLHWRVTGQAWQTTSMTTPLSTALAYGNRLLQLRATIPGPSVTPAGLEYRIEVTDGWVTETTPTYPVVVTNRPPGTATVFVPPAGVGPLDSEVPLLVRAKSSDGSDFDGTVRWCAQAVGSTSTGCISGGTAEATGGVAGFSVRPTTAAPTLRVTAYADQFNLGTQDPTELPGAAVVAGFNPPNPAEVTTVAFTPPVTHGTQGSSVPLSFRALRGNGTAFTGPVRWGTQTPGGLPTYSGGEAWAGSDGTGQLSVSAGSLPTQVFAYADSPTGGVQYSQDPTEVAAAAVVIGTPTPPAGTALAFTAPVGQGPTGSTVSLPFRATNADGSAYSGPVRYSVREAGQVPVYDGSTSASGGNGSVPVTVTGRAVQVFAYADIGTSGTQDPNEGAGAAAVVNSTPPPPPAPGTEVVVTNPVQRTFAGVAVTVFFTALNYDGSPFVGNVNWGQAPVGSTVQYTGTVTLTAADNGNGRFNVVSGSAPVVASAYADRAASGVPNSHDETEVAGAAAVIGT